MNGRALTILAAAVVLCALGCGGRGGEPPTTLTVGAAASLTDALTAIGGDYEASHPGARVQFRFGASSLVARQIIEGAPADVFLSANSANMQRLADRGLIVAETRRDVLTNRLVIISPSSRPVAIDRPEDILGEAVRRIAVCDPVVPIGGYTKAYLASRGLYQRARPRFVRFSNVRAALAAVDGGHVDLGFVYQSDAAVAKASTVVFRVPEAEGPRIRYPGAVLAESRSPRKARAFLDYLGSPAAARRFEAYGFTSAPVATVETPAIRAANVWRITALSLRVALVATIVVAVPGILLGYALARCRFHGKNVLRTVVVLPMVLPPVATGFLLLLLFSRRGPVGAFLTDTLGVQVVYTWWAAALAAAVVGFPLLVRSAEGAFAEVPDRLIAMAGTLGARGRRRFFTVALPLARRGVAYGLLFCFARSLGEFGATAVLAGIGRGTETLALGTWSRIEASRDSAALALMGVSAVLAFAAMFCCETFLRPRRKTERTG